MLLTGTSISAKDVSGIDHGVILLQDIVQFSLAKCNFTGKRYQDQISETKLDFSGNFCPCADVGRSHTHFNKLPSM